MNPSALKILWCRWSESGDITLSFALSSPSLSFIRCLSERRNMASVVSNTGTPIARSGTPTDTRNEFGELNMSGSVDTTKPMNIDPESPRKTLAGW